MKSSLLDACTQNSRVADAFEAALSILRTGHHRDEYVYKAALTQKVLLGTHSLKTACMINEFRVADCKADLVILNGTAAVYEIKSERIRSLVWEDRLRLTRRFSPVCM